MGSYQKKGNNGGRRDGAGRKRGNKNKATILKENAEATFINTFLVEFDELMETKRLLAFGDYYIDNGDKDSKGKARIYKALPNNQVIEQILDRIMGKPKMEIKTEGNSTFNSPALDSMAESLRQILTKK